MSGYFLLIPAIISAIVVLVGLVVHEIASVAIAFRNPQNAADIITAMGQSFPLRGLWWRRRK